MIMNNKKLRKKARKIYKDLYFDFGRIFLPEDRAYVLDLVSDWNKLIYFSRNLKDDHRHLLANMMLTVMDFLDANKSKREADQGVNRENWLVVNSALEKLSKLI